LKKVLSYIIPFVVAIVLVWGIFLFVDYDTIIGNIAQANIYWILLAIAVSLLAHLSRAYRWKLLLQPLGYNPSLKHMFIAVMTAYFGNIFIPRGGEVMRCAVLNRSDKVPFTSSFATVVAERVVDMLCLLVLVAFSFVLEYERFMKFFTENVLAAKNDSEQSFPLTYVLLASALVGTIFFFSFKKYFLRVPFIKKIYDFVVSLFIQAYNSFRLLSKKKEFVLHTVLIWLGYYLMTYLAFFALPYTAHLGALASFVLLIVGGLGMSAPASGGIGPFHILVAGALTLFYGLSKDDGVAFAFVLHTAQLISLLIVGGICAFWSLFLGKKEIQQESDAVADTLSNQE
jgi:uncharacterized protein (TIRG00374 family)